MVDLNPVMDITAEDLKTWYGLQAELARVKAAEAMLRSRIFKQLFPKPVEGSKENKYPTSKLDPNDTSGAIVQATHVVTRNVLEPELAELRASQAAAHYTEDGQPLASNVPKLPLDKLVRWRPELVKAEYNKLTDEERKLFDTALEITDGSPQLEIKIPKRAS